MQYDYTSKLEAALDDIAAGHGDWQAMLADEAVELKGMVQRVMDRRQAEVLDELFEQLEHHFMPVRGAGCCVFVCVPTFLWVCFCVCSDFPLGLFRCLHLCLIDCLHLCVIHCLHLCINVVMHCLYVGTWVMVNVMVNTVSRGEAVPQLWRNPQHPYGLLCCRRIHWVPLLPRLHLRATAVNRQGRRRQRSDVWYAQQRPRVQCFVFLYCTIAGFDCTDHINNVEYTHTNHTLTAH